jgi:putative phosphoesterase
LKIAVLSDIHGNYAALLSVITELKKEKVEKLLILGDIVGYYYHPDKILYELDNWEYHLIKGNHEEILIELIDGEADPSFIKSKYGSGHEYAIKKLNSNQINKLLTAPIQINIEIDGLKISMNHGSPLNPNLYIYPDSNKEILDSSAIPLFDIVLIGHSHYQFLYTSMNTVLLNPGSVGQSRSTGGFADWAIINTKNKVIQLRSTIYDTIELEREIQKIDPDNSYLLNILKRNRI